MKLLKTRFLAVTMATAMLTTTAGIPVCAEQTETAVSEASAETQVQTEGGQDTEAQQEEAETQEEINLSKEEEGAEAPKETEVSQEEAGTEPTQETETPQETEAPKETETAKETETSQETEAPKETEIPQETENTKESETAKETEIPQETEPSNNDKRPAAPSKESDKETEKGKIEETEAESLEKPGYYALNDGFEADGLQYKEIGGGRVRLMNGQKAAGDLVIPAQVKKPGTEKIYQIVSIADAAFIDNTNLTGVTFPSGLTGIGARAFLGCTSLTGKLVLPESLTSLGEYAFKMCGGLEGDLKIPESLTDIGEYAFQGCTGLKGSLVLPKGMTRIAKGMFYNCEGLQGTVALPDTLTEIGTDAFFGGKYTCEASTETVAALAYGSGYRNVTLNGTAYTLQEDNIPVFKVGNLEYKILNETQGYVQVNSCESQISGVVTIPDTVAYKEKIYRVTEIGSGAFQGKADITEINLPEGLLRIGEGAFENCVGLNGVLRLPEGLESIGKNAFNNCSNLSGILEIPDSVAVVGRMAFQSCSGIRQFRVGKGLQTVGATAFPKGAKVWAASPRVQLLLVEYLDSDEIPEAAWDGQEDVPVGAIVTVDKDTVISGNVTISDEAEVTVSSGVTVTVKGALNIEGTVTVKGTLLSKGTIKIAESGQLIRRKQKKFILKDPGTKTYGDRNFTLKASGGSSSGGVSYQSSDAGVISLKGEKAVIRGAGTAKITATKAADYTYEESSASITVTVERKPVTFQADNVTVRKDEALPVFTYTHGTLAYQDQVETEPLFFCGIKDTSEIGKYPIELSEAVLTNHKNYVVTYLPGTLTVEEKKEENDGDKKTSGDKKTEAKRTEPVNGTIAVPGLMSENGDIFVEITQEDIGKAVGQAQKEAENRTVEAGGLSLTVQVEPEQEKAEKLSGRLEVGLPQDVQKELADSKVSRISFVSEQAGISIGLDQEALKAVMKQAEGARIIVARAEGRTLSGEAQIAIGNRPVYELSVLNKDTMEPVTDFGSGKISVSFTYGLKEEERPGGMYAVYVDENGDAEYLVGSVYEADEERLYFAAGRTGLYGIGYRTPVTYEDIEMHWAKDAIEFAVGRELVGSEEKNVFGPDEPIEAEIFTLALEKLTGSEVKNGLGEYFAVGDSLGNVTRAQACSLLKEYTKRMITGTGSDGWLRDGAGNWLYYKDGRRLEGLQTIDGLQYEFGEDGLLIVK